MSIKATLFACVIAAAGFGCRQDRNDREPTYSRTIESTDQGARNTLQTDEGGHTVHDTGGPAAGAGGSVRSGTEVDDDSDSASIPNRDSTGANVGAGQGAAAGGASAGANAPMTAGANPAPSTTGNGAIGASDNGVDTTGQSHHAGRDAGISNTMKSGARGTMTSPSPGSTGTGNTSATGVSETASGNGTTTRTGTNSENQGTGNTDDPTR